MAKFYVQSGTMKAVVSADDSRKAALWAVHRAMQQVLPMYEEAEESADEKCDHAVSEGMMILDQRIKLSEIGFDRFDAEVLDTSDVVNEWNKLMVALTRLEELL